MGIRTAFLAALYVAFVLAVDPAQALEFEAKAADIPADEMSSIEWRDCAAYFFFLMRGLQSASDSASDEDLINRMAVKGMMAIYASEDKAKAERKAGLNKNGLGRSLADPVSGKLQVDLQSMINTHTIKSNTYPDIKAYVNDYAVKCAAPVAAFSKRFTASLGGG